MTIRPGTASSASPTREKGTALTSAPLIRTALAAVGCRAAAPSDEVPGVTPLAPAATRWFERTAVLFRAPRFCDGFGRATRPAGVTSGAVMVTGGSWRGLDAVRSCAAAGSIRTAEEAVAENIRNKTLRTAMPPHVYC